MLLSSFRHASIKTKLMLSMAVCLLVFLVVSVGLGISLTGRSLRTRVVEQELPAVVDGIRNDILRQIAVPMTASLAIADNPFLHAWERKGLPEAGVPAWLDYARAVKARNKADAVFRVSAASGKPYSMRLGQNIAHNGTTLYINARFDVNGGDGARKAGVAGIGLSVDAMADAVHAYRIGESGFVYLVRDGGNILMHRDTRLADGAHDIKDLPGFDEALRGKLLARQRFVHAGYAAPDGRHLVASSFVPELNMYVVAEVPEAEALGGIASSASIAALAAAFRLAEAAHQGCRAGRARARAEAASVRPGAPVLEIL